MTGGPSGGGFTVRDARPDELDEAGAVAVRAYRALAVRVPDDYLAHVGDAAGRARDGVVLVAVDTADGRVLGTVTYVPDAASTQAELARGREAGFRVLGVDPGARGRGIGEALVRACIERARIAGRTGLAISTSLDMPAALHLYARLGFRHDPARDWSPRPGIDLLAYVLELSPDAPPATGR